MKFDDTNTNDVTTMTESVSFIPSQMFKNQNNISLDKNKMKLFSHNIL